LFFHRLYGLFHRLYGLFHVLQALHRYSELLLLLTGRRPSELLPPTPPSYIVNRVWQLARSTCVKDFNWVSFAKLWVDGRA
jgi:hypothetical protein